MKSNEGLKDLLSQLEGFFSTKTVIGDPIHMEDTIILPVVDVSFGVGAGAKDKCYEKNGLAETAGGAGGKMSPSAILVIKDGDVRLVSLKNQDTVTKVLEMVPDVLGRVTKAFSSAKENLEARKVVDEKYKTQE